MNQRWAPKIVLFAVLVGILIFALSFVAQILSARQLQDVGWNICPGFISAIFNSALLLGALAALSASALLLVIRHLRRKRTHVAEAGC